MADLVFTLGVVWPSQWPEYCGVGYRPSWPGLFCSLYRLLFESSVGDILFVAVLVVVVGFLLRFGWDAAGRLRNRPK